jgi:hypothetical protein
VPGSPLRTPQEPLASASGEDRRQVQPTLSGERGGGSVYPPRSCARLHAPSRKRAWGVQGGVHAFARLHAQKDSRQPTVAKLARRLKPGRSNASRRVRSAKSTDFERDLEDNLRKPLPEDLEMLPAPHKSQAYKACTRAGEIGGIHDTLPQETAIRTPRRGRGYIPPENECTRARFVCLQGSGGRRSAKTLESSDGKNRVAPSQPSLPSQDLNAKEAQTCRKLATVASVATVETPPAPTLPSLPTQELSVKRSNPAEKHRRYRRYGR